MKDFGEQMLEQTDAIHKMIIDDGEDVEIDGRKLKRVWVGDVDGYDTYWDPVSYDEVEVDDNIC